MPLASIIDPARVPHLSPVHRLVISFDGVQGLSLLAVCVRLTAAKSAVRHTTRKKEREGVEGGHDHEEEEK